MNPSSESPYRFMHCVRADLHRHYERFGWFLLLRAILFKRTFAPVFTLRVCQAFDRPGLSRVLQLFGRVGHRWACARAAIDLPWQTSIGPGFRIVHGFGLIVNARARIGCNVTVFQGATIGQRDRRRDGTSTTDYPAIGDEVLVGAYAMVLGVDVGKGSTIAPLSVVIDPVDPADVVSGNPAQVIKRGSAPYVSKAWPTLKPQVPSYAGERQRLSDPQRNAPGLRP